MVYTIASPDEYLAITGAGIKSIKITKSAWVWPFQKCQRFSIQPRDYSLALQAMTREKLQFMLPVVFTVGPDVGNPQAAKDDTTNVESNEVHPLEKYAMLLADGKTGNGFSSHVQNIIKGIIEGETRVLVSSMTMEEIFAERDAFKKRVFNNIQAELDQFGLKVYNAKVKELGDSPGTDYFAQVSKKSHEHIRNEVETFLANDSLVAATSRFNSQGQQYVENARIMDEVTVTSAGYHRTTTQALIESLKLKKEYSITEVETRRAVEIRDEELQKEVERKRAERELEHQRVSDITRAKIRAYEEKALADTEFNRQMRAEDIEAYRSRSQALNRVCSPTLGNLAYLRDLYLSIGKEALDFSPWSSLSEQEKADSLLAEFVNLTESGGAPSGQIDSPSLPSILWHMMAENNKAALLVRALLDVADSGDDVQVGNVPVMTAGPSLQHRDSGIFVEE